MSRFLSDIRGVASGKILFDEKDLPLLLPYSWSVGSHGYAQGCGNGVKAITMHQLLMGTTPPGMLIDHINRVPLDNRRNNLRFVTPHESNMNRMVTGGNVYQVRSGRFAARLKRKGKIVNLGTFDTFEEADHAALSWRRARGEPVQ